MKTSCRIAALIAAIALAVGFSAAQPPQQAAKNSYRPAYSGDTAGGDSAPLLKDPPDFEASNESTSPPEEDQIGSTLDDARTSAILFAGSLPNLICRQTTDRFEDLHGDGNWRHIDSIDESLSYVGNEESRTLLGGEANGRKISAADMQQFGMYSAGEFGDALAGIFALSSKAEIEWKETGAIGSDPVEVFEYRVLRENSGFALRTDADELLTAGYHGRIYIDRATHGVRSVTLMTDDLPKGFPIHRAAVRIDYDYVAIEDLNYLLPVKAEVVMGYGKNKLKRNELRFSDFQRFGSTSRILASTPIEKSETKPETHQ